tara:strand:- start:19329 stop:20522 length:1194 start_codon:yes stop_codon:yes gene_type:complete
MPFKKLKPNISANTVIDSSLSVDKLVGQVEEAHWAYTDDVDISWGYSSFNTVHDFYFPKTGLGIFKGRHIQWSAEGYHDTQSSSRSDGTFEFQIEVEVPNVQVATSIGNATHESTAGGSHNVVSFEGNLASNRIGSGGSIGTQGGNYRTYKNLYYDPKASTGSDLVTNGNFNSGTANWTLGAGTHSSGYGAYSLASPSSGQGFSYQALTTVVGEVYSVTGNITGGNISGMIRISTAADLVENTTIATSGAINAVQATSFEFTATSTTTYIILATSGATSQGQYRGFDNLVVKQYLRKTYVLISTTGGTIVPTDGTPTALFYHPYSGASSGTYAVVDTMKQTFRMRNYVNYLRFEQQAYIGWFNDDIKIRIRCKNTGAFGKTLTINDMKIFMNSRIVE